VFAGLIIVARVLAAGIITLRSSIWRFNYPRATRAQIIGRITMIATAGFAAAAFCGAKLLDIWPGSYAAFYPAAALLGAFGIWQFSHIRVRGEGRMLKEVKRKHRRAAFAPISTPRPEGLAESDEVNVLNYQPEARAAGDAPRAGRDFLGLRGLLHESLTILREDRWFRRYQYWQGLQGSAFMMMNPPLIAMVSRDMTDPKTQYLLATVVLQIVPLITTVVFTQVWAPVFDKLHILKFRAVQGWINVACMGVILAGAQLNLLWLVAVGQLVAGIANAAGALAWNLGQNDFAPPEKITQYMGVHVMLTGVRGCVAPFLGVLFYEQLIGRWVFAVTMGMCVLSLWGYLQMAREAPTKHPRHGHEPAGATSHQIVRPAAVERV
jgi:hypothetical protein